MGRYHFLEQSSNFTFWNHVRIIYESYWNYISYKNNVKTIFKSPTVLLSRQSNQGSEISVGSSGASSPPHPARPTSCGGPRPWGQTPGALGPRPRWASGHASPWPAAGPGSPRPPTARAAGRHAAGPPDPKCAGPKVGNLSCSALGFGFGVTTGSSPPSRLKYQLRQYSVLRLLVRSRRWNPLFSGLPSVIVRMAHPCVPWSSNNQKLFGYMCDQKFNWWLAMQALFLTN